MSSNTSTRYCGECRNITTDAYASGRVVIKCLKDSRVVGKRRSACNDFVPLRREKP
jgi:hypothetical protein